MSGYLISKLCHRIHHDVPFRNAVLADPEKAIADWPFTDAERKALLAGDVKQLYEWGAHPFLLGHSHALGRFRCDDTVVFRIDPAGKRSRIAASASVRSGKPDRLDHLAPVGQFALEVGFGFLLVAHLRFKADLGECLLDVGVAHGLVDRRVQFHHDGIGRFGRDKKPTQVPDWKLAMPASA